MEVESISDDEKNNRRLKKKIVLSMYVFLHSSTCDWDSYSNCCDKCNFIRELINHCHKI